MVSNRELGLTNAILIGHRCDKTTGYLIIINHLCIIELNRIELRHKHKYYIWKRHLSLTFWIAIRASCSLFTSSLPPLLAEIRISDRDEGWPCVLKGDVGSLLSCNGEMYACTYPAALRDGRHRGTQLFWSWHRRDLHIRAHTAY
jgi:hypothetical protein